MGAGSAGKGRMRWAGKKGSGEPVSLKKSSGSASHGLAAPAPTATETLTSGQVASGRKACGETVRSVSRTDWPVGDKGAELGENCSCDWWKDIPVLASVLIRQRRTHILYFHWLTCLGGGAN